MPRLSEKKAKEEVPLLAEKHQHLRSLIIQRRNSSLGIQEKTCLAELETLLGRVGNSQDTFATRINQKEMATDLTA